MVRALPPQRREFCLDRGDRIAGETVVDGTYRPLAPELRAIAEDQYDGGNRGAHRRGSLRGLPHPARPLSTDGEGDGGRSERQRQAALPGDIVLGLVEAVAVELVDEVATLGADTDAPEAVLEPCAEVAGELGPGVACVELMHADRAGPAEQVRRQRGGPGLDEITQHEVCVIGEFVELAATRQRGAAKTVVLPAAAGADADVPVQPHVSVVRGDPPQAPVGGSGG